MKNFLYILVIYFLFIPNIFAKSAPESFADLVEDLLPAVVSIASKMIIEESKQQTIPKFPEGSPFTSSEGAGCPSSLVLLTLIGYLLTPLQLCGLFVQHAHPSIPSCDIILVSPALDAAGTIKITANNASIE